MRVRHRLTLAVLMPAALLAAACGGGDDDSGGTAATAPDGATELVGLFTLTTGSCEGGAPNGTYFRMVQPNGTLDSGPFVTNSDSACQDKTVTPLRPGSDGGLRTGGFQPNADPAFDPGGNAVVSALTQPATWFAVEFGLSTNEKDPQTGVTVKAPLVQTSGGTLTADTRALSAAWNGQHFNQGAPKPDGSLPGLTRAASGTYDEATRAFTLEWSSQIVGGAFNNFTGVWHLEGTFTP